MISLSRVKQATAEFIKVLRFGKSDVQTSTPILPFGVDSKPVADTLAAYSKTTSKNESLILGYYVSSDETNEGETRIYCTDADGVEQFSMYFKNDGTVEFGGDADNLARFSDLKTGFDQLKSDFNSFITTTFNLHTHVSASPRSPTATPVPTGTSSTASIDSAKIDEIKTS